MRLEDIKMETMTFTRIIDALPNLDKTEKELLINIYGRPLILSNLRKTPFLTF
jgi:hypothetical protein